MNEDKNIDDILPCSTEHLCEDKNLIQTESRSMANTDENLLNCNVELKDAQPTVSAVLDRGFHNYYTLFAIFYLFTRWLY